MNTKQRVQEALYSIDLDSYLRNFQIGQLVEHKGHKSVVLGVGIIDYHPDGPAYEAVEIEYIGDPSWPTKHVVFSVDLEEWMEDE